MLEGWGESEIMLLNLTASSWPGLPSSMSWEQAAECRRGQSGFNLPSSMIGTWQVAIIPQGPQAPPPNRFRALQCAQNRFGDWDPWDQDWSVVRNSGWGERKVNDGRSVDEISQQCNLIWSKLLFLGESSPTVSSKGFDRRIVLALYTFAFAYFSTAGAGVMGKSFHF